MAGYLGKSLGEIAAAEGRMVIEVLCDLALRSELELRIKSLPFTATDAVWVLACCPIQPSPEAFPMAARIPSPFRVAATLPKCSSGWSRNRRYSRWNRCITSSASRSRKPYNLSDRGAILPGYWADIVIYSLDELYFDRTRHEIVYDMPGGDWRCLLNSGGYRRILVNGVTTYIDGKATGMMPGQFVAA